ncbi:hypothetical protein H0H92_011345 [Tricholoma furcatifolium]|nr:hypothetical protein H0H92_011345 [Tricholoma furcatifolium]
MPENGIGLSPALISQIIGEHVRWEDFFDDDIALEPFAAWYTRSCLGSAMRNNIQVLFPHTPPSRCSHWVGTCFLVKDSWHVPGSVDRSQPESHRLAIQHIDRKFSDFANPLEMLSVLRDVVSAHEQMYYHVWLHRDITPRNILIDREGRGYLVDWDDMDTYKEEKPSESKGKND